MEIIRIERIKLSKEKAKALDLTIRICEGIERESNDPELKKLANETYLKLADLWNMEDMTI